MPPFSGKTTADVSGTTAVGADLADKMIVRNHLIEPELVKQLFLIPIELGKLALLPLALFHETVPRRPSESLSIFIDSLSRAGVSFALLQKASSKSARLAAPHLNCAKPEHVDCRHARRLESRGVG